MPQFTYDTNGNAVGVFLPIEDWNRIQEKLPLENEMPQWQMDILDHRLASLAANPDSVMPLEDFIAEMEKEANGTV